MRRKEISMANYNKIVIIFRAFEYKMWNFYCIKKYKDFQDKREKKNLY